MQKHCGDLHVGGVQCSLDPSPLSDVPGFYRLVLLLDIRWKSRR